MTSKPTHWPTATVTAVHATAGHVLWVHPPSGAAIHLDFVQDFLSNIAASSPGLLPLASQCNHAYQCKNTRHPQRRDPHTEFLLALRTRFATLIVPFVSRDFRGLLHALDGRHHSGPSHRCQVQPSSSGQDQHVDTHGVIRGQRRYHCAQDLSRISLGQQLQSVNFWVHRGIE